MLKMQMQDAVRRSEGTGEDADEEGNVVDISLQGNRTSMSYRPEKTWATKSFTLITMNRLRLSRINGLNTGELPEM
jgi:hypothetical protein